MHPARAVHSALSLSVLVNITLSAFRRLVINASEVSLWKNMYSIRRRRVTDLVTKNTQCGNGAESTCFTHVVSCRKVFIDDGTVLVQQAFFSTSYLLTNIPFTIYRQRQNLAESLSTSVLRLRLYCSVATARLIAGSEPESVTCGNQLGSRRSWTMVG